jgi:hypothetical protein
MEMSDNIEKTEESIKSLLGEDIFEHVKAITDEPGKNRKERKLKTYKKTLKNKIATTVKVADRIANVEESKKNDPKLLKMYKKEYPEFKSNLKVDLGDNKLNKILEKMWNHLDSLMGD